MVIQCVACSASIESNRHNSTLVACSENNAKFTPFPSHVAPSGYEFPGQTRMVRPPVECVRSARGASRPGPAPVEPTPSFLTLHFIASCMPRQQRVVGRCAGPCDGTSGYLRHETCTPLGMAESLTI